MYRALQLFTHRFCIKIGDPTVPGWIIFSEWFEPEHAMRKNSKRRSSTAPAAQLSLNVAGEPQTLAGFFVAPLPTLTRSTQWMVYRRTPLLAVAQMPSRFHAMELASYLAQIKSGPQPRRI
jgi:hypothetical protein